MRRVFIKTLKIHVTPLTADQVLRILSTPQERTITVVGHNLHSVYLYHSSSTFREFYNQADIILMDGQPIRWLYNLENWKYRLDSSHRVGSVDWLANISKSDLDSIAVVGAAAQSNSATVKILEQASGAKVFGYSGEPWNDKIAHEIVKKISASHPELMLVGLGMPLQETFVFKNDFTSVKIIAIVGGAIDQIAGVQVRAPSFMQRVGLEWFWRLSLEPKRFWRRYLVEPLLLTFHLLFQCRKSETCKNMRDRG